MSDTQLIYKCTPRQVREFSIDVLEAGKVPFVTSSPGCGKSEIFKSIADELGLKLIDHRLTTSEPTDLTGLPNFDKNGYAYYAPFREIFPLEDTPLPKGYDGWLLFLDEANSADRRVQAASYKVVLDKMIGQRRLHERVVIAMAGNLMTDKAIVVPLSTAMESRTVQLEMEVDFDEWEMDVALPRNYDFRILAFLREFPSLLMDFKPNKESKSCCCPRTWSFMNDLIRGKEVEQRKNPLYAGTITPGVAAKFSSHCELYKDLVTIPEILADPRNCRLPVNTPVQWATIYKMQEHVNDNNFDHLAKYADRFDMTFKILFFRGALQKDQSYRHHPAFANSGSTLMRYLA